MRLLRTESEDLRKNQEETSLRRRSVQREIQFSQPMTMKTGMTIRPWKVWWAEIELYHEGSKKIGKLTPIDIETISLKIRIVYMLVLWRAFSHSIQQ